jgi:ketosteroid isomerase-like protein
VEKIDRLRRGYEAFDRGELDTDFFAPDFVLHQASSVVDTAGVFHGREAVRDVMREMEDAFEELRVEAEEFIGAPNGEVVVFVRMRGRGRGSGVEVDNLIAHVWTFRDEQAVRLVVYEEPREALQAVGLGE